MEIITLGMGERLRIAASRLSRIATDAYDRLLLLPIPTTKDKMHITATDIPLEEVFLHSRAGALAVGYELPAEIRHGLLLRGTDVLDLGYDERLLGENAEITARGALGHVLTTVKTDITELKVGIIGYGRIGRALLRLLVFLGARARVYTTRDSVAEMLCDTGVVCEKITESTNFSGCDILLNTAPARLIDEERLSALLPSTRIIDLASGRNFPEREGIERLASIPELFYPVSAGRVYADGVERYLLGEVGIC